VVYSNALSDNIMTRNFS